MKHLKLYEQYFKDLSLEDQLRSHINSGLPSSLDDHKEEIYQMFLEVKDQIKEMDWYGSGGGFTHYMILFKSGKIISFHPAPPSFIDVTHYTYDSIEEYYSPETVYEDDYEEKIKGDGTCYRGFDGETECANYNERSINLDENINNYHKLPLLIADAIDDYD